MEFNSVNKLIEKSIKEHWDKDALSNYQGITLKYKDVAQRIKFLHIAFEKCGLKKGEKVALCSRNQANWGVCFLATMTYGAVPVPLLHEFKAESIHYLVNHSEAKVLFVDEVIWEGLSEQEMPELEVIVQMNTLKFIYAKSPEFQAVRDNITDIFNAMYPAGFTRDDVSYYEDSADELALINYTSGTSGFSKGVMIPYRALYSNIEFAIRDAEPQLDSNSKVVAMLPSAHMYGMMFEFLFEMTIGMHVHFLTRIPSPKIIMQAFADIQPDVIIAVPLIIEKVYKSKLKPILDRNRLFFKLPFLDKVLERKVRNELVHSFGGNFEEIILGGAAFNPEVESFFHKIGFPYTVGYGMTECAPIITYAHWDKAKLYSCGRPALNMEIRIDSPDPENVPGEVQVKGPNVFLGYYKNEEATRASFTDDGWFRTGDLATMDKDHSVFIVGRSKSMILTPNGQNIYPEEIEVVLNALPGVAESLIVNRNDRLVALIVPDQNQFGDMDAAGLKSIMDANIEALNKKIPAYSHVSGYEIRFEPFVKTPKGSIRRFMYA